MRNYMRRSINLQTPNSELDLECVVPGTTPDISVGQTPDDQEPVNLEYSTRFERMTGQDQIWRLAAGNADWVSDPPINQYADASKSFEPESSVL